MTFGGRGAAAEAAAEAEAEKRSDGEKARTSERERERGRDMGLNCSVGKSASGVDFLELGGWAVTKTAQGKVFAENSPSTPAHVGRSV
jgi:hypothetical protein